MSVRFFLELNRRFWSIFSRFTGDCKHGAECSIDESGDGSMIEWECIFCGKVRVDDRNE